MPLKGQNPALTPTPEPKVHEFEQVRGWELTEKQLGHSST